MTPGASKRKGNAWEREVGRLLSLWLTDGDREDLFARTVLSGGQFTSSKKKGKETVNGGDLMANHPLAFPFCEKFSVEMKHWKNVRLSEFLLKNSDKSEIKKAIEQARKGAESKFFMLVIKGNFFPPFVILPKESPLQICVPHHVIFDSYIIMTLNDMLSMPTPSF